MANNKTATDGLVNVASGLGVGKAKRDHNQFVAGSLNEFQQLEAAYQTNWIASRICDVPAADATREWRRVKSEGAEDVQNLEKELCVQQQVEEALIWSRLYGGAAIVMLTDQDLTKPLNLNRVKKGSLKNLLVFDRWDLGAYEQNTWDVLAQNYLRPEYYNIRGGSLRVHWSHVVRFDGKRLPRRLQAQTQGWGDSELRRCIADVADMVAAKDGIAELMQEANIDVLTRENLSDELTSDQDDAIIKRYTIFSQMKSNIQMALLDGSETLTRNTLNLSGVAPIIEQFITWISGAAGMPVTKLFGTAAKGLNATGEGDMRNYYDEIRGLQSGRLSQSMRTLDEVLVRSALGNFPTNFDYIWNPLEQSNEVEIAQAGLLRAQKDRIYLEDQIIKSSQIQRNLQSDESYQFDDEQIEQLEESEDLNMFEGMGQTTGEYANEFAANNE
jgi:phage-related protein (TIGR01555 family)